MLAVTDATAPPSAYVPPDVDAYVREVRVASKTDREVAVWGSLWLGSGVVFAAGAIVLSPPGGALLPAVVAGVCATLIAAVWWAHRRGVGWLLVRAGAAAAAARDFDTAYALFARAEQTSSAGLVRAGAATQRAAIALTCGWTEEAITELDHALAWSGNRSIGALVLLEARSLRALAHALSGAHSRARDDVALFRRAIEAGEPASVALDERKLGEFAARAALAEVVVASQTGDDVKRVAAERRDVVLGYALPRERALFRAILVGGAATKLAPASPYRESAGAPRGAPRTARDWVSMFVPNVVLPVEPREGKPFVDRDRGVFGVSRRKVSSGLGFLKAFAVFSAIGSIAVLAWRISGAPLPGMPAGTRVADTTAPVDGSLPTPVVLGITLAVGGIFVALLQLRVRKDVRASNLRMMRLVRGAPGALDAIRASTPAVLYPKLVRLCVLARAAFLQGRFDVAKALSHEALDLVAGMKIQANDATGATADLHATVLAAAGLAQAARGEVATIPFDHAERGASRLRVELITALREVRFDDATRIAESLTEDVPIDAPTELLVDLLLARREGGGEPRIAVRARLREDLRAPELRTFVEAIAPRLLRDLDRLDR